MAYKNEIRIQHVPDTLKEELQNIAAHKGVTLQQFLKPLLKDISNSYPKEMKLPPRKD